MDKKQRLPEISREENDVGKIWKKQRANRIMTEKTLF
jgi:hypothetical protein